MDDTTAQLRKRVAVALDIGRARIGVAVTDPRADQALPLSVLERKGTRQDIARLLPVFDRSGAQVIVVGLPPSQPDTPGSAHLARQFAAALADAQSRPIFLVDEADTTALADAEQRLLGASAARRRRDIDRHAAKQILDRWLGGQPAWPVAATPAADTP